jgi:hypothetical protein
MAENYKYIHKHTTAESVAPRPAKIFLPVRDKKVGSSAQHNLVKKAQVSEDERIIKISHYILILARTRLLVS